MSTQNEFEVTVSAEVDEDELIADVIYRGCGVADVRHVEGSWVVTVYVPASSDRVTFPFQGFLASLEEARARLESVYGRELEP